MKFHSCCRSRKPCFRQNLAYWVIGRAGQIVEEVEKMSAYRFDERV